MARTYQIDADAEAVQKDLAKSFQSAHINFILGAGASQPAIPLAGDVEREVERCIAAGDEAGALSRLYGLVTGIQEPTNVLLDGKTEAAVEATLNTYRAFLHAVELILTERRTTLLQKQATVFTTNYDVLIDLAAHACHTALVATGFDRVPSPQGAPEYSAGRFFHATYAAGTLYDYRVELPSINLVKLHGCLSWRRNGDRIELGPAQRPLPGDDADQSAVDRFMATYALVLPQPAKLHTAVLDRTYYDLLRLYANALDREGVLLVAFGFSFRDEHILHITRRALKNPTLRIVIVAHDVASATSFGTTFASYNNVIVIAPSDGAVIGGAEFTDLLGACVPKRVDA